MRTGRSIAIAGLALFGLVASAKASPITYTEFADVSGSLNGVSFTNALLTLTGTADTASITGGPSFFTIPVTASFTVAGAGTGTLTSPFIVFNQQLTHTAGFEPTGSDDLLDTTNAAFASYNLSTSIGPVTGLSSINSGVHFSTNVGTLILTSAGDATFTANGGAVSAVSAVPLPATLPLFATGVGALGLLGWRRKRKAQAV